MICIVAKKKFLPKELIYALKYLKIKKCFEHFMKSKLIFHKINCFSTF